MFEVSPALVNLRRASLRVGLVAAAAALTAGVAVPPAIADSVADKQRRAAALAEQQSGAAADVRQSQANVTSATDTLLKSQAALDDAQSKLAGVRGELQQARAYDKQLAAELAQARADLAAAKKATAQGAADVAAQRRLLGQAAREAFQSHSDLTGVTVVFGAESPAQLEQRMQWNTTVFDAQTQDRLRLGEALTRLEAAQARQDAAEKKAASDKDAAAAQVGVVAGLEHEASAQAATVARLVATNERNRAAAQGELTADEARYRELSKESADLTRQIQAQIAAEREAARQRAIAEAKRRAAEKARAEAAAKREAARQAAAKAAAARAAREAEAARIAENRARSAKERAQRAAKARAAVAKAQRLRVAAANASRTASRAAAVSRQSASSRATSVVRTASVRGRVSARGFVSPVNATPGSSYGLRFHPILKYWRMHNGTDFGAACGMPLHAAMSGKVLWAGPRGGFGNFVLLGHGEQPGGYLTTGYAHQSRIVVRTGQTVQQGQIIGYVGTTGLSTGCHLHFEVRHNGVPTNPLAYLP
ncbi:M23 family metallopeptidase [Nigerium massiliense]|uniref:M23 family metallopeptidase n=1 Tax=Nigerium massiliense TaxID=1522317 RepID=UPI00058BC313|nr:M23 family metallopeptidase [Nigerium massiliense]